MEFNSLFQNSEMKCTWPEQMSVMIWSCVNNIYQIILSFVYGMSSSICNIEVFCCIHTSTHVYTSILQPHLFSILLFFFLHYFCSNTVSIFYSRENTVTVANINICGVHLTSFAKQSKNKIHSNCALQFSYRFQNIQFQFFI